MRKIRVRGVIFEGDYVILIHRVMDGKEYYVFPGGGSEEGEDLEMTLKRECLEELGINVSLMNQLYTLIEKDGSSQIFYNCCRVSGVLGTGQGPEFLPKLKSKGTYILEKIRIGAMNDLPVLPEKIKDNLCKDLLTYRDIDKIPHRVIYDL